MELEKNPRLGVNDKRQLFQVLLAITERLFALNRFPVDQEDYALSLQTPEVEAAWKLIRQENTVRSTQPVQEQYFMCNDIKWKMHVYPDDKPTPNFHGWQRVFMNVAKPIDIGIARRHQLVVNTWCVRQQRLEDQLLRAASVIREIVRSCNTVGQYKRVSPDLLTFLPEKYQLALRDYTKQSPYPTIGVRPEEIDTTLSSLAFAALQPEHHSEKEYRDRISWNSWGYNLDPFPRSADYDGNHARSLNL